MMNNLYHTVRRGDTFESIANLYTKATGQDLYDRQDDTFKRSSSIDSPLIVGSHILVPGDLVTKYPSTTTEHHIQRAGWRPLFNMHMHFQSNNCCPLPIQWGLEFFLVGMSRRGVNTLGANKAASWRVGRMGRLGRLRTDLVCGIFWGESQDANMPEDNAWIIKNAETPEIAGAEAQLTELSDTTRLRSHSFYELAKENYYGRHNHLECFAIGLMMDLSYGHHWGQMGLPINLVIHSSGRRFYLNDHSYIALSQPGMYSLGPGMYSFGSDIRSLVARFNNITYSIETRSVSEKECSLKTIFEKNCALSQLSISIREEDRVHIEKKFTHIVTELPGDDETGEGEAEWFEDFPKQILHTEGSCVKFALKQLAFYHFDPRRYYCDEAELTKKANEIYNDHGFFEVALQGRTLHLTTPVEFRSAESIKNLICQKDGMMPIEKAFEKLVHNGGLFWGVKMYPRLGYTPNSTRKYPALHELYKECAQEGIPITAHCSRGGMKIADYRNFYRYATHSDISRSKEEEKEYEFSNTFTSPANWEPIINNDAYRGIKINLAHFGGFDLWHELGFFEDLKHPDSTALPKGDGFGNDSEKSGLFNRWVKKIAEMMAPENGLYTDISYFHLKEKWFSKRKDRVLENLVYMIENYPILKDRILLGTDWYMTEIENLQGDGPVLANMFDLLKILSTRQLYDKRDPDNPIEIPQFDAWHQFTVINPMRFLGLIDESSGEMKVKTERLKMLKDRAIEFAEDDNWCSEACALGIEKESVEQSAQEIIDQFERMPLHSAEDIFRANRGRQC